MKQLAELLIIVEKPLCSDTGPVLSSTGDLTSVSVGPDRTFLYRFVGTSEDPHNEARLAPAEVRTPQTRPLNTLMVRPSTVCPFTGRCGMSAGSVSGHAGHPLSEGQGLFPSSPP